MGDAINDERLSYADQVEDDMELLGLSDIGQESEELAASGSVEEAGTSEDGNESDAATSVDDSEDDAADNEEASSDEEGSDEDSEESEESQEDAEESEGEPEGAESEDVEDGGDDDPPAEAIEQAEQTYEKARQSVLDEVASKFIPLAEKAKQAISEADEELEKLKEKYTPDEDNFVQTMTFEDQLRISQLDRQREKAIDTLERVKSEFTPSVEKAEREIMIQHNLMTYPKLKQVEEGFREALNRGITFDSVAEAVEVSSALMRVKGKAITKRTAPKAKPKPGEIERAALEASIARKKAGSITAGKGSSGAKGVSPKGDPYKGLPTEVAEGLRMWDEALASS